MKKRPFLFYALQKLDVPHCFLVQLQILPKEIFTSAILCTQRQPSRRRLNQTILFFWNMLLGSKRWWYILNFWTILVGWLVHPFPSFYWVLEIFFLWVWRDDGVQVNFSELTFLIGVGLFGGGLERLDESLLDSLFADFIGFALKFFQKRLSCLFACVRHPIKII